MIKTSISMRELQRMTAGDIQALERPMLIKSGTVTVGQIKPIRPRTKDEIEAINRRHEEWQKTWTEEHWEEARRILRERGIPEE